eukprot:COSAG02_NODE_7674_length_2900_cov_3.148518_3_plen_53_part_00
MVSVLDEMKIASLLNVTPRDSSSVGKRGFLAHPLTADFWPTQATPGRLPRVY